MGILVEVFEASMLNGVQDRGLLRLFGRRLGLRAVWRYLRVCFGGGRRACLKFLTLRSEGVRQ